MTAAAAGRITAMSDFRRLLSSAVEALGVSMIAAGLAMLLGVWVLLVVLGAYAVWAGHDLLDRP